MGIVDKLKQEFDITAEWRSVEIHPDTPGEGRPLTELFPAGDIGRMVQHLRISGAAYGITFSDLQLLSNSRSALQAAEFARDHGKFDAFHEALFAAYFSLGLDIGNLDVLSQLARDAGLDAGEMKRVLSNGQYIVRLEEARKEAGLLGLTGVPTFFIGDKKSIVGVQPLDVFRKILLAL